MNIQVYYFAKCPNFQQALQNLRTAIEQMGLQKDLTVHQVLVATEDMAQQVKFIGSPSFILNGVDLFGVPPNVNYGLRCRIYLLEDRATGMPTVNEFRDALKKYFAEHKDPKKLKKSV